MLYQRISPILCEALYQRVSLILCENNVITKISLIVCEVRTTMLDQRISLILCEVWNNNVVPQNFIESV